MDAPLKEHRAQVFSRFRRAVAKRKACITRAQAVLLLKGKHTLMGRRSDVEKYQGI